MKTDDSGMNKNQSEKKRWKEREDEDGRQEKTESLAILPT